MPPVSEERIVAEQVLRLIYPLEVLNSPLTNQLIRQFAELTVNILRAEVTSNSGWMEIQLVGTAGLIETAIDWLHHRGVEVQVLGA